VISGGDRLLARMSSTGLMREQPDAFTAPTRGPAGGPPPVASAAPVAAEAVLPVQHLARPGLAMNTTRNDLYAILELTPSATGAELRRSYRALLRRYHPDTRECTRDQTASSSDLALQELLAAYEVLGDPTRRAAYDRRNDPAPRAGTTAVRVHPRQAGRAGAGTDDVPIRAGPVRWHGSH